MKDVTAFINGTAVPSTHEDFIALAHEAHRQMDIINSHLRQILCRAGNRDNDTQGG